jgi:hypothetical protein
MIAARVGDLVRRVAVIGAGTAGAMAAAFAAAEGAETLARANARQVARSSSRAAAAATMPRVDGAGSSPTRHIRAFFVRGRSRSRSPSSSAAGNPPGREQGPASCSRRRTPVMFAIVAAAGAAQRASMVPSPVSSRWRTDGGSGEGRAAARARSSSQPTGLAPQRERVAAIPRRAGTTVHPAPSPTATRHRSRRSPAFARSRLLRATPGDAESAAGSSSPIAGAAAVGADVSSGALAPRATPGRSSGAVDRAGRGGVGVRARADTRTVGGVLRRASGQLADAGRVGRRAVLPAGAARRDERRRRSGCWCAAAQWATRATEGGGRGQGEPREWTHALEAGAPRAISREKYSTRSARSARNFLGPGPRDARPASPRSGERSPQAQTMTQS